MGRVAELLFFSYLFLVIIGYSGLLPVFKMENILPMLEYGFKPVIHGSLLLLAFPYLEGVLFLFFAPHVQNLTKWKSIMVKSTMMSGITFLVITFLVIGTLSEGVTANLTYPSYFVLRTVNFADIYERFEQLFAILWYITIFFSLDITSTRRFTWAGWDLSVKERKVTTHPVVIHRAHQCEGYFP